MNELKCAKCGTTMALAKESDGDLMELMVICICKHRNSFDFLGYPRLAGTHEIYFEFTDEEEITCHKR